MEDHRSRSRDVTRPRQRSARTLAAWLLPVLSALALPQCSAQHEERTATDSQRLGSFQAGIYTIGDTQSFLIDGGFYHWDGSTTEAVYQAGAGNTYQQWQFTASGSGFTICNVADAPQVCLSDGGANLAIGVATDVWSVVAAGAGYTLQNQGTGRYIADPSPPANAATVPMSGAASSWSLASVGGSGVDAGSGRYEAENSATNLPTETRWPGYSGASYLCCWSGDGQYATFTVNVSAAGTYTLSFGYSAGNGDATRSLAVNGAVVSGNQTFPGTADWSSWTTVPISVNLPAGDSAVTLTFVSASGSFNYINLDYLDVSGGSGPPPPPPPPPPTGQYNDTNPAIVYSTGPNETPMIWSYGDDPNDFDGDEHYTNVYGSSFTVNFSGVDFQWIGKKGPNFGIATVDLDGQQVKTVDNYAPSTLAQQVLYSVNGLSDGPHVFKAAIGGYPNPAKNPASSDTYQVMDGFVTSGTPLVLSGVAASGGGVTRTGSWTCGNDNDDLSGSHCWSNVAGSTMTIDFSGTGIEVYARPDGENGIASVYLDGNYLYAYDGFGLPYDSSCDDCVNGQDVIAIDGLVSGPHSFELVVSSSKNQASEDYYTQIDEFMVIP